MYKSSWGVAAKKEETASYRYEKRLNINLHVAGFEPVTQRPQLCVLTIELSNTPKKM